MTNQFCKSRFARTFLLVLAFSLAVPLLRATILGNGGSVPPSSLVPGGTLLATESGTITTPTFVDNFTQKVYSDPNNTWCAGCLDFVYQFTNLGPDVNARFTMYNFAGFSLDVGTDPFGVHDPTLIDRSVSGAVVGFNYPGADEISPGETTPLLVIETNAHSFDSNGFLSAQDGTSGYATAFEPAAGTDDSVPEPSSLVLMGTGLLGLASQMRKKLKK